MLEEQITKLLGRKPDIEQTDDGQFIVMFMSFNNSPPPKGATREEAMEKFITYYEGIQNEQQSSVRS